MPLDLAVHCSAHAEQFHARLPLQPHCCVPLYHPLSDYEWRAHAPRLRALEGERHQRERQNIMQVEQQPQVYQARLDRYLGKRTYNQRIEHAGARDSVHANTQVQVPAVESSLAHRVGWEDTRDAWDRAGASESSSVEFIESDSVQIVDTDSVQIVDTDSVQIVEQASSRTNQQPPADQ